MYFYQRLKYFGYRYSDVVQKKNLLYIKLDLKMMLFLIDYVSQHK